MSKLSVIYFIYLQLYNGYQFLYRFHRLDLSRRLSLVFFIPNGISVYLFVHLYGRRWVVAGVRLFFVYTVTALQVRVEYRLIRCMYH